MQLAIILLFASSVLACTDSDGAYGDYNVYGYYGYGKYDTYGFPEYGMFSFYNGEYSATYYDAVAPLGYLGYTTNIMKMNLPPIYGSRKLLSHNGVYANSEYTRYGNYDYDNKNDYSDDNNTDDNDTNGGDNDNNNGNDNHSDSDDNNSIGNDEVNFVPSPPVKNSGYSNSVFPVFIVFGSFALACML